MTCLNNLSVHLEDGSTFITVPAITDIQIDVIHVMRQMKLDIRDWEVSKSGKYSIGIVEQRGIDVVAMAIRYIDSGIIELDFSARNAHTAKNFISAFDRLRDQYVTPEIVVLTRSFESVAA